MSKYLWQRGFSYRISEAGGRGVQRIDGAYLYELGANLRPILSLKEEDTTKIRVNYVISPAFDVLRGLLFESVFSQYARNARITGNVLLDSLADMSIDLNDFESFDHEIANWSISSLKTKFRAFEAVILAELQNFPLYLVYLKGGFEAASLTDGGLALFPTALSRKCPEATNDVLMGARSLAFELWTAMGFHFHRANEAVLRRYYDSLIGTRKQPKMRTMGTMLKSLNDHDLGDANIRAALSNIVTFHRNPIAHPDHHIASSDEALSLYAAIRACMGYMLDQLPEVQPQIEAPATSAEPLFQVGDELAG